MERETGTRADEGGEMGMIKEYIIKIDDDQNKKDIHGGFPLIEPPLELVRCKDCKWYDERISMCDNCGLPREQMFFCADGRRRDKND